MRSVRVVMDHSPRFDFSLIDVRYAMLDGDLRFCKLKLSMLNTRFAGHIPGAAGELVSYLVI
jgi:hypothetical protein